MKELTQEDKIKLAPIMGWEVRGDILILDPISYIDLNNPVTDEHFIKIVNWNPSTNAEQFQALEDAFIEKYKVDQIGYFKTALDNWECFYYTEFVQPRICEGEAETKQLASLNAMLNKLEG